MSEKPHIQKTIRSHHNGVINVTKTYLPPLVEYVTYLERIWESYHLTNNGPLVKELEAKLKAYLGVKHLFFVTNGTIALQIAIKALDLRGEIITTPFSYVATTSSIVWEGCDPIFVDIDPETLCIDPDLIEAAITPRTTAILAVHVYGNPCHVERIQTIADRHGLKVIYDAAHAFGVNYRHAPIANYGDVTMLSFHATKLFHTGEGGAIATNNDQHAHALDYMRRFGHKSPYDFWGLGINGKGSELHAAMGLSVLPNVPGLIEMRSAVAQGYDESLSEAFRSTRLSKPKTPMGTVYNFSYYPILFESEEVLVGVVDALNAERVFPRRYFYPSLNTLDYVKYQPAPVSESTAARILCLPLSHELTEEQVHFISNIVRKNL